VDSARLSVDNATRTDGCLDTRPDQCWLRPKQFAAVTPRDWLVIVKTTVTSVSSLFTEHQRMKAIQCQENVVEKLNGKITNNSGM